MNLRARNDKRTSFVRMNADKMKKLIEFIDDTKVSFTGLREARKMIELARKKLDYSPWTSDHDIFIGLIKVHEKIHKKDLGTAHG